MTEYFSDRETGLVNALRNQVFIFTGIRNNCSGYCHGDVIGN